MIQKLFLSIMVLFCTVPALAQTVNVFTPLTPKGVPDTTEYLKMEGHPWISFARDAGGDNALYRRAVDAGLCEPKGPCGFRLHVLLMQKELKKKSESPPTMLIRYLLVNDRNHIEGLSFSQESTKTYRYWRAKYGIWIECEPYTSQYRNELRFVTDLWKFTRALALKELAKTKEGS